MGPNPDKVANPLFPLDTVTQTPTTRVLLKHVTLPELAADATLMSAATKPADNAEAAATKLTHQPSQERRDDERARSGLRAVEGSLTAMSMVLL